MNKPNLEQTVALMKAEILRDMACGIVPLTVASFSELHDYVDANCYGGFCDDKVVDSLIAFFGGRDSNEAMPDGMMKFINDAQTAVDHWLQQEHSMDVDLGHKPESRVYVQTRRTTLQGWADSMGTSDTKLAVEFAQYQRANGLHARVIVRSAFVIA